MARIEDVTATRPVGQASSDDVSVLNSDGSTVGTVDVGSGGLVHLSEFGEHCVGDFVGGP